MGYCADKQVINTQIDGHTFVAEAQSIAMTIEPPNAISVNQVTIQLYIYYCKHRSWSILDEIIAGGVINSNGANTFVCTINYWSRNRHRNL